MTHLDEKALLPCPFCGKEPIFTRTVEDDNFDRWFHVRCEECAIEIGDEYRSDAINTWNRRASPALPSSPVSEWTAHLERVSSALEKNGFSLEAEDCQALSSTLTTLSTRNAELEREVKRLREALSGCCCPRPVNAREYGFTVGECVAAGECGCCDGETLRPLSISPQGGEHE